MSSRQHSISMLVIGVVCGAGLSIAYTAWGAKDSCSVPVLGWRDAQLFAEVFERIKRDYVEDVTDASLTDGAVRGLAGRLDSYSAYLDPEEFAEVRMSTAGEYSGVGIEISRADGRLSVIAVLEDSPAAHAGIRAADSVIAVDNVPIDAANLGESVERMRGRPGSQVKLTLSRSTAPLPIDVVVTRGTVQVHTVKQEVLEPGYAYIRISQFNTNTAADFSSALAALQQKQPLRGLVLDLRNNPGGVLDTAVAVADALLERGTIVTAEGRAADAKFAMSAHAGDLMRGAPIAVLVNGSSASAAEIVAGALHDHKRAVLVGQTTFGKGSVQSVLPLAGGSALKLTTSHYHTPSGASLHRQGIVPDVILNTSAKATSLAGDGAPSLSNDAEVRVALAKVKDAAL